MSVNFKELQERYVKKCEEICLNNNIEGPCPVTITSNTTKIRDGIAALLFKIAVPVDNDTAPTTKSSAINVTLYIADRRKSAGVFFVNDKTHDVIFNNSGPEAVDKCEKYVCRYIDRNIKRLYGLNTDTESSDNK